MEKKLKDINVARISLIIINSVGALIMIFFIFLNIGLAPLDKNSDLDIPFIISENDTLKDISHNLKIEGIIKNEISFYLKSYILGEYYNYDSKEYILNKSMSVNEIIKELSNPSK